MSEQLDKLITELGDLCHEHYLGSAQNKTAPDGYEYSYDNEVIHLLNTPEARELITKVITQELNKFAEEVKRDVIGEDVPDNGAIVVRNFDGSVHSSSAGSYAEHIKSDLRATQRTALTAKLDEWRER